jgi:hypothetical protein
MHLSAVPPLMAYLMRLASGLPTAGGEYWDWESSGGYCFWCDRCRVSGWLCQCI